MSPALGQCLIALCGTAGGAKQMQSAQELAPLVAVGVVFQKKNDVLIVLCPFKAHLPL